MCTNRNFCFFSIVLTDEIKTRYQSTETDLTWVANLMVAFLRGAETEYRLCRKVRTVTGTSFKSSRRSAAEIQGVPVERDPAYLILRLLCSRLNNLNKYSIIVYCTYNLLTLYKAKTTLLTPCSPLSSALHLWHRAAAPGLQASKLGTHREGHLRVLLALSWVLRLEEGGAT
jgi:hypothetical protein